MYDPDAQVVRLLVAWREDIDSEPFAHQDAVTRAAFQWATIRRRLSIVDNVTDAIMNGERSPSER